jgi:hypothetical protein
MDFVESIQQKLQINLLNTQTSNRTLLMIVLEC